MEIIVALVLSAAGILVIRSLLLGTATSRQSKRHTGEYISPSYRLKMGRQNRSEFVANRQLAGR